SSLAGSNLPVGYPLGIQPGPSSLLYNFHTTAATSGNVTFCFVPVQIFQKPERVRVFLIGGIPVDITTSISPIPTPPTQGKPLASVCGSAPFSSTTVSLAVLEPANNPPALNASLAQQININPAQGITGQLSLDATSANDPDSNPCNGNSTICQD